MDSSSSSASQIHGFVNTTPDAIIVADPIPASIVAVNHAAEELIGHIRKELLGMELTDPHPADETERSRRLFQRHH